VLEGCGKLSVANYPAVNAGGTRLQFVPNSADAILVGLIGNFRARSITVYMEVEKNCFFNSLVVITYTLIKCGKQKMMK
jgi:hypothetical protein